MVHDRRMRNAKRNPARLTLLVTLVNLIYLIIYLFTWKAWKTSRVVWFGSVRMGGRHNFASDEINASQGGLYLNYRHMHT